MNNNQNNTVSMFRTVVSVCKANAGAVGKIKAFEASLGFFEDKIKELLNTAKEQEMVITGIAEDKEVQKRGLAKTGAIIGAAVKGYALTNKNLELAAVVNFSESALYKMKEEDLIFNSEIIHKKALDNMGALADYGVNKPILDDFNLQITNFSNKKPEPASAKVSKEMLTDKLADLIDDASEILKEQMDNSSKMFKLLDADFYDLYKGARKIIDRGRRAANTGLLNGVVMGKNTAADTENVPLEDVLLHLIELNLVVVSNEKGEFDFDDIEAGTYTLKVSKQGYKDEIIKEVKIDKGEERDLYIEMSIN
jgi:hypothetical protein